MPAQDALVIGLGYVGLPLAVQVARAGFRVTGFDTSAEIAAGVNAGRSHVTTSPPPRSSRPGRGGSGRHPTRRRSGRRT